MFKSIDIKNNITGVQNLLIDEAIKANSNIQLLKSEQAIQQVLKSYADKFNEIGGKLTNMSSHYVEPKQIIDKKEFNSLFDSLYIDLKTLYSQIENIDNILELNLGRNKKFFGILKKRIKELWNKLDITRSYMSTTSIFDESYYEAFSSELDSNIYKNLKVNKKTSKVSLVPKDIKLRNKRYLIKKVTSKTFPVHNPEGGVFHFTSPLNKFENSYRKDGTNDMLENGLWKEQIFTKDIPEIRYNLSEDDNHPIWRTYTGIVSIVDIEFTNDVDINNLLVDLYGEHKTGIVAVLYLKNGIWTSVSKTSSIEAFLGFDQVEEFKEVYDYDLINIQNLNVFKTNKLRIVFNQKNYKLLSSEQFSNINIEDKINNDLSERRYELLKLDNNTDDKPSVPVSYNSENLYSELIDVIESTKSIDETLTKIVNILNPPQNVVNIDFNSTLMYELGAWEIEPSLKKYQRNGIFKSSPYKITDKSLLTVNINSKNEVLSNNTLTWSISTKNSDRYIPILEQGTSIRKEPVFFVKPEYLINRGWNDGSFIQLDFPIDLTLLESSCYLYFNGEQVPLRTLTYNVLNSSLLYIKEIKDPTKHNITVQYVPAMYDTVKCFVLENISTDDDNLIHQVAAPRESLLSTFLYDIGKSDDYHVRMCRITKSEYELLFNISSNNNLFLTTTYIYNDDDGIFKINKGDFYYDEYGFDNVTPNILGAVRPMFIRRNVERGLYA